MPYSLAAILCFAASLDSHSCNQLKEKPQLVQFVTHHPIAAAAIGKNQPLSNNITSSAIRLSTRVGLDNLANGDGRGTEVNALRHSLWQATITARFGSDIAEQAGNAYEHNAIRQNTFLYPDRYSADEAVDLRNNAIGRNIGATHRNHNMQQLAQLLLQTYYQQGLWTAQAIQKDNKTMWRISQTRINNNQYENAINKLSKLNEYGMNINEQKLMRQSK